jgi:hypothetical protein
MSRSKIKYGRQLQYQKGKSIDVTTQFRTYFSIIAPCHDGFISLSLYFFDSFSLINETTYLVLPGTIIGNTAF